MKGKIYSFPSLSCAWDLVWIWLINVIHVQCDIYDTVLSNVSMIFIPSFCLKSGRDIWTLEAVRKRLRESQECWTWILRAAELVILAATLRLWLDWWQTTLTCINRSKQYFTNCRQTQFLPDIDASPDKGKNSGESSWEWHPERSFRT